MTRFLFAIVIVSALVSPSFAHGGGGGHGWAGDVYGGRDSVRIDRAPSKSDPSGAGSLGYIGGGGWDTIPRPSQIVRPETSPPPAPAPAPAPRVKSYERAHKTMLLPTYNPRALFTPNNQA